MNYTNQVREIKKLIGSSNVYCVNEKEELFDIPKDTDVIIYFSPLEYNEDKMIKIKELASKMSDENNKKVSLGYSYIIPTSKRESCNCGIGIQIGTFEDKSQVFMTSNGWKTYCQLDLIESTLSKHNEQKEIMKVRKKARRKAK